MKCWKQQLKLFGYIYIQKHPFRLFHRVKISISNRILSQNLVCLLEDPVKVHYFKEKYSLSLRREKHEWWKWFSNMIAYWFMVLVVTWRIQLERRDWGLWHRRPQIGWIFLIINRIGISYFSRRSCATTVLFWKDTRPDQRRLKSCRKPVFSFGKTDFVIKLRYRHRWQV